MTQMQPFALEATKTRSVQIDGGTWYVARDVTEALGYKNAADAVEKHCGGTATYAKIATAGGSQRVRIISSHDVLRLLNRSKLPASVPVETSSAELIMQALSLTTCESAYTPSPVKPEWIYTGDTRILLEAATYLLKGWTLAQTAEVFDIDSKGIMPQLRRLLRREMRALKIKVEYFRWRDLRSMRANEEFWTPILWDMLLATKHE